MKIKETAVVHDHTDQGGWGSEWVMPAAIQDINNMRYTISLGLPGIVGQFIECCVP